MFNESTINTFWNYNIFYTVLYIVSKNYHDYKVYSYWLYKIFYYLDKFAMPYYGITLCNTSLKIFKEEYFNKCNKLILNTIFQFIQETRNKGILLNKQIKQLIQLFSDMDSKEVRFQIKKEDQNQNYDYSCLKKEKVELFYKDQFEALLLQETSKFYQDEIYEKQRFTTIEFINWANSFYKLELDMCMECYPKSYQAIENKLKQMLFKDQVARLVDSPTGLGYMLQYDRTDELKQLFQFIIRIKECLIHVAKYFQQKGELINNSIAKEGQQLTNHHQYYEAEFYFTRILELMEISQNILQHQLQEEQEVQYSYSEALMFLINQNENSSKWLATYIDIIIRKEKGENKIETDEWLSKIVSLFQSLYQKDVFFQHYQQFLSRRLLNQWIQNLQLEKSILQKFKGETSYNFLTQLSTMINDIELSNRFGTDQQINKDTKFNLNVILLTDGCWPIINIQDNIIKPIQIQSILENYQKMYLDKHKERIVIWCCNMGKGELIYKMKTEKYYLNVNTMQMIAFLQFNQVDSFSIKNFLDITKMDKIDLENSLIPFVCTKIISRDKQDIEDFSDENEVLKLNLGFTNKAKKIRLLPNQKMSPKRPSNDKQENEEKQRQMEYIKIQRETVVDSQLLKLMKSKKTITHHELFENCQSMISIFKPDFKFIKNRIEHLIQREYIIRDEKEWNIYHYLN